MPAQTRSQTRARRAANVRRTLAIGKVRKSVVRDSESRYWHNHLVNDLAHDRLMAEWFGQWDQAAAAEAALMRQRHDAQLQEALDRARREREEGSIVLAASVRGADQRRARRRTRRKAAPRRRRR